MRKSARTFIGLISLAAVLPTAVHALNAIEAEEAKRGEKKALVSAAKEILAAPAVAGKGFVNDPWGAACLLKLSSDHGYKPATDLLMEKHKSIANASAFLLKGISEQCRGAKPNGICEPFVGDGEKQSAFVSYVGKCNKQEDRLSKSPNAYSNPYSGFTVCLGSLEKYELSLADAITAEAYEVDPVLMVDVYMAADPTIQAKLAPAIQKESASKVASRYLADKNFVQARFWYKKAEDTAGLAEVDKREQAIAEFQENKRKAEAEALAAHEAEQKKAVADEAAKREAELKAEEEKRASAMRIEQEKQAAAQKLALQRQEMERNLAHEQEAGQRKLTEERAAAVNESERKHAEGLKSGAIPVANLNDAITKYDAQDGADLVKSPPLSAREGVWYLKGALVSLENGVPGQSGTVYMCSAYYGNFAFITDKDMAHLSIKQSLGIVGKHVATNEASGKNGTVVYVPIFKAVEVIGN